MQGSKGELSDKLIITLKAGATLQRIGPTSLGIDSQVLDSE